MRYLLDGPEGRHAAVVQRRETGERIDICDGAGIRLHCVVAGNASAGSTAGAAGRGGKGADTLAVDVQAVVSEPAPAPIVTLVQALAKGDRDIQAIEAAVECGVDAVIPWQANRSITRWKPERAAKSHAKWVDTARAASKQARRAWTPPVDQLHTTKQLAARAREVVAAGGAALILHEEAASSIIGAPIPMVEQGTERPPIETTPVNLLVIVGPEGGIGDDELALLTDAGAVAVRLGPHVMRTSTAGPVAVALLCQRLGRWELPPGIASNTASHAASNVALNATPNARPDDAPINQPAFPGADG
jgi:16S rRNA (uracil1498-N3)-methyltransferase